MTTKVIAAQYRPTRGNTLWIHSVLLYTLLKCTRLVSVAVAAQDEPAPEKLKLPTIWGSTVGVGTAGEIGTFRILSELRLVGQEQGSKPSVYFAEEWATGSDKGYRLDLIPLDRTTNKLSSRKTVVVNGLERYYYEPYKCMPIDRLDGGKERAPPLEAELRKIFPQNHELVIGGLGSILLHASSKSVTFMQAAESSETTPAKSVANNKSQQSGKATDAKELNLIAFRRALSGYDQFIVAASEEFSYMTRFLFQSNGLRRDDGNIDPGTLKAVHLIDPVTNEIRMSAKIIEIDTRIDAYVKLSKRPDLFELPIGYGCIRRPTGEQGSTPAGSTVDDNKPVQYRPPLECFAHLDTGDSRPRACYIQAETMVGRRPHVHSTALRFASGKLNGRPYVTLERRHIAQTGAPKSRGGSGLQRSKRIWDLADATADSASSGSIESDAIYFELSSHMSKCTGYRAANLDQVASIEFPILVPLNEPIWDYSPQEMGLSLGPQMMRELFITTEGYHTIRENKANWLRYSDYTQEKRIDRFKLFDKRGQVAWTGPVSVVRKFNEVKSVTLGSESESSSSFDIDVDVCFYSQSLDKQLARLHLRISPAQFIDQAYLHRELDIGPCLHKYSQQATGTDLDDSDSATDGGGGNDDGDHDDNELAVFNSDILPPTNGGLKFTIIYPLDLDASTNDRQLVSQIEEQVYEKFLDKLLNLHGANWVNPLQVRGLRVDIEADSVIRISVTLDKWPEVFNFYKRPGLRFTDDLEHYRLASEIKPSEAACAESCSHFNCPMLAYCATAKACEISSFDPLNQPKDDHRSQEPAPETIVKTKWHDEKFIFKAAYNCNVLQRRATSRNSHFRGHASPAEVFNKMQALIASEPGDDDPLNPLAIELNLSEPDPESAAAIDTKVTAGATERRVLLLPSAISIADDQDLRRFELTTSTGSGGGERYDPLDESGAFAAEYDVLYRDHKLIKRDEDWRQFPLEEAHCGTYTDCELLCSQEDCSSFSYCPMEKTCLVSHHSFEHRIRWSMVEEPLCFISIRIPLSKFMKGNQVITTRDELKASKQCDKIDSNSSAIDAQQTRIPGKGISTSRECANECATGYKNYGDFICKSFLFCPELVDYNEACTLLSNWQGNIPNGYDDDENNSQANQPPAKAQPNDDPNSSARPLTCDLYRRSFLIDCNKIPAKQLKPTTDMPSTGLAIHLLLDLDADACAYECSSFSSNPARCVAFHVCAGSSGQGDSDRRLNRLSCAILVAGDRLDSSATNNLDQLKQGLMSGELLKEASKCTTFVNKKTDSDETDANNEPISGGGGGDEDDGTYSGEKMPASQSNLTWNLMATSLIVLLGLAIGYSLTWLLAMQNYRVSTLIMSLRHERMRVSQMRNEEV